MPGEQRASPGLSAILGVVEIKPLMAEVLGEEL
jgi:hypothetical protein